MSKVKTLKAKKVSKVVTKKGAKKIDNNVLSF